MRAEMTTWAVLLVTWRHPKTGHVFCGDPLCSELWKNKAEWAKAFSANAVGA